MSRPWLKHGWIAPAILLLLFAVFLLRKKDSEPQTKARSSKPAIAKLDNNETATASQSESRKETPKKKVAKRLETASSNEGVEERSAADIIAADPLKSSLKEALTKFSTAATYTYDIGVKVYEDGKLVLETKSTGQVKDQEIVMGLTELGGEVYEVATCGAESRIRHPGEEWTQTDNGWYEASEVDPRAAQAAQMWADPVLASMPLEAAPEETVDGVRCTAMKLSLDGSLPADEGEVAGKGATGVTFIVGPDGQMRKWRLKTEIVQDGKKLTTEAEAAFNGFNVPWSTPLPEWMGK